MTTNRSMALRIVWGTRVDDDTPAADARELLEMCGLVEPAGHEILPDLTPTGRLIDEQGRPVATAPVRSPGAPPPAKKRRGGPGRKPVPIEHGTDHGYRQHKQKREPIPADDACGCQAAHDALLTRHRRPAATSVPDPLTGAPLPTEPPTPAEAMAEQAALDLPIGDGITRPPHFPAPPGITVPPPMAAPVSGDTLVRATEIRDRVDEISPRANPDGSVNASHVAMEQTLRQRAGLPSYIPDLDGPGAFLPDPPLADWEQALVADPFDPEHPALQVPAGFVPGGHDEGEPTATPTAAPDPGRQPPTVPTSPTDLDEWLAAAQRSRRPGVRRHAQTAVLALLQLRCALDDLSRAERSPT